MTLEDLIIATQSTLDQEYMKTVDVEKIQISRKNPTSNFPLYLNVDLNENFVELKNGDNITVPKKLILKEVESVVVTGEIKTPGLYPVNDFSSIQSIVDLAGGFTDKSLYNGIEIFRDSLIVGWNNLDFPLLKGDSLNVLKKTGSVRVQGEVNSRGYYSYKKGDSIKEYLRRAGGLIIADPRDVFITYPMVITTFIWHNEPKGFRGFNNYCKLEKNIRFIKRPNRWKFLDS